MGCGWYIIGGLVSCREVLNHNNELLIGFSFMICCDQCEEWYHGDCVGISVGQGKRMEREGKEYICPVCVARLQDAKEEREMNRYVV